MTATILNFPDMPPERQARRLYWMGWGVQQIADELTLPRPTVASWARRGKWQEITPRDAVDDALAHRINMLIAKEKWDGYDFKLFDALMRGWERGARIRRFEAPDGKEADLNPNILARNAGPKKKKQKNHLTAEHVEQLLAAFDRGLFDYQKNWRSPAGLRAGTALSTRFILKSRQIGATFYFAREALIRAIETGNNQIFISASRNQANIFREYIVAFVLSVTGVKLEGDPIELSIEGVTGPEGEPPKLYFLGTNYRTAQGYHGDVYIDECFWIYGFEQIWKVASAMASQKRYRKTLFSTPSTIAHEAYPLWNGERFNKRRSKDQRVEIDTSHKALKGGQRAGDGIWRQIVTLEDAAEGGCDLFDLDELLLEYSPDEFDQLFRCIFVDDAHSMFPFEMMRRCMVDSWEDWRADFDPYALRPFGDGEVWIGFDPQESAAGDDGACVVVAPPTRPGGKFRVIEKFRWRGDDFETQARKIRELADRYNVTKIAIDTTGIGAAVWQLVVKWFPTATRLDYSVPLKTAMVLKAKNVISKGRLEFDAGWIDVAQSFMSIRAELTPSQRQVTYVASRAGDTGHADVAWAIMHAVYFEPLDGDLVSQKSSVEFS